MIYFRKLVDMFFLSIVPSIFSFLCMWRFMGYKTWFIGCIVSVLIFYVGNALLMRRFVRDIKSKTEYYKVWLITFVVYTALGTLCLWQDWMYPFTWMFFHSRFISILTIPSGDELPVWMSFAISMIAYLVLTLAAYPICSKSYQRELELQEEEKKQEDFYRRELRKQLEKAGRSSAPAQTPAEEAREYHHRTRHHEDDNARYSKRQYQRMQEFGSMDIRKRSRIGRNKKTGERTVNMIMDFILNIGSYGFYQMIHDKEAMGIDTKPLVSAYIRRKLNLGMSMKPDSHRYRRKYK